MGGVYVCVCVCVCVCDTEWKQEGMRELERNGERKIQSKSDTDREGGRKVK